jgi:hypothetical protein
LLADPKDDNMMRAIITMVLAGALMAMGIPGALANSENSKSTAGAGTTECRPGAEGNDLVGGWETIDKESCIAELIASVPIDHPDYYNIVNIYIPRSADATWTFCDKNLDGTLCVLRTEPSPYSYLLLDNRPFAPK